MRKRCMKQRSRAITMKAAITTPIIARSLRAHCAQNHLPVGTVVLDILTAASLSIEKLKTDESPSGEKADPRRHRPCFQNALVVRLDGGSRGTLYDTTLVTLAFATHTQ